jgi:HSP20 family protein
MALIRYNDPFSGLTSMHSQLDDMFNSFFGGAGMQRPVAAPAMDVYTEDDKALVAEVQAPGFTKDDIEVNVHDGVLEIKGEKHASKEEGKEKEGRNYMVRESHHSFYRSIALPRIADGDHVAAQFDNGVLKVTVPLKELPSPKKVAISDGK